MTVIFVVVNIDIWATPGFLSEPFYTNWVFQNNFFDLSLKTEAIFVTTIWYIENDSE